MFGGIGGQRRGQRQLIGVDQPHHLVELPHGDHAVFVQRLDRGIGRGQIDHADDGADDKLDAHERHHEVETGFDGYVL